MIESATDEELMIEPATDNDLLPLDPACPWCSEHTGVGEIFDGGEHNCQECGRLVMAVEWTDGTMTMTRIERGATDERSGRERTRARWRRRGRR